MSEKTILLVDDDRALTALLGFRCQSLGVDFQAAGDGLEAQFMIQDSPPDLLVLDIDMPVADGLTLCECLMKDPRYSQIPVIVLTGRSDPQTIQKCTDLKARYCHKNLEVWEQLKPIIVDVFGLDDTRVASRQTAETVGSWSDGPASPQSDPTLKSTVLVVDDDHAITKALWIRLGALGVEVIRSPDGKAGLSAAIRERPDVIVTDYRMPLVSGDQFLHELKNDVRTAEIPVIVLTGAKIEGKQDYALKREMLGRNGAVGFLSKPLDFDSLLHELRRHIELPDRTQPRVKSG